MVFIKECYFHPQFQIPGAQLSFEFDGCNIFKFGNAVHPGATHIRQVGVHLMPEVGSQVVSPVGAKSPRTVKVSLVFFKRKRY